MTVFKLAAIYKLKHVYLANSMLTSKILEH